MPIAEARVETQRASRYLVQLCRHVNQLTGHRFSRLPAHVTGSHRMPARVDAEWSETEGTVSVDGGTCMLRATPDSLLLRAEAAEEETLLRIQEMISRNLTRFSGRDPLTVAWHRSEPVSARPRRRRTFILAAAGVLAVAAHLVLGGAVLAAPPWAGWAADAILIVVLIKVAIVGLGYLAHRRRRA